MLAASPFYLFCLMEGWGWLKNRNPKVNEFEKSISSMPDLHINKLLIVCACGASINIIMYEVLDDLLLSPSGC